MYVQRCSQSELLAYMPGRYYEEACKFEGVSTQESSLVRKRLSPRRPVQHGRSPLLRGKSSSALQL